MKIVAFLLLSMSSTVLPRAPRPDAQQKSEDLARKSAKAWRALTDWDSYGESWDEDSSTFDKLRAAPNPFWMTLDKAARAVSYFITPVLWKP